jgi:hypothetical protein
VSHVDAFAALFLDDGQGPHLAHVVVVPHGHILKSEFQL